MEEPRATSRRMIWFKDYSSEEVAWMFKNNLLEALGIELVEIGPDFVVCSMPVDHRTSNPIGILHGGASVALAESICSIAGNLLVDPARQSCVGLEINANHIRSIKSGTVWGRAQPVHLGRRTQVWETRILDAQNQLICTSRMTLSILDRPVSKGSASS